MGWVNGRHQSIIADGVHFLASTEILKKNGGTSWVTVASLPKSRRHFSGVTLPNGHFIVSGEGYLHYYALLRTSILFIIAGGYAHHPKDPRLSDVLKYDPEADKWIKVGDLDSARDSHAMSLVPKETADHCGKQICTPQHRPLRCRFEKN